MCFFENRQTDSGLVLSAGNSGGADVVGGADVDVEVVGGFEMSGCQMRSLWQPDTTSLHSANVRPPLVWFERALHRFAHRLAVLRSAPLRIATHQLASGKRATKN